MNNNLLFSNKFIQSLNTVDVPSEKKRDFKNHIEKQQKPEIPNNNVERKLDYSINDNQLKTEKTSIICIDSKDRNQTFFPSPSDFDIYLGKTFVNVKSIKLVSTEFPNTDQVITNFPSEIQNNLISWQNSEDINLNFFTGLNMSTYDTNFIDIVFSGSNPHSLVVGTTKIITIYNSKLNTDLVVTGIFDGDIQITVIDDVTLRFPYLGGVTGGATASVNLGYPTYTITIKPGNYSIKTLATEMTKEFNSVRRLNGSGQFHYFTVTANIDTDVLTFDSVITYQLINNPINTTAGSTLITVYQLNHGFKSNDRVTMINVLNTAGISGAVLSGVFTATVLDFNTFTYEVNVKANDTVQGGGNSVLSGSDAPFRMLFESENTLIQYNIGFLDEDSSEDLGVSNPITTSALNVNNVQIINSGNKLRFTTTTNHNLEACTVLNIVSLVNGINNSIIVTTSSPHLLKIPSLITIRNTVSVPTVNGVFVATPNGLSTFTIKGALITVSNINGQVLHGNDKIAVYNLKTAPNIALIPDFYVENINSATSFDISFNTTSIDANTISSCVIGTTQIYINHPNHKYNVLSSISSISNTPFTNIGTFLPHTLVGSRTDAVSITASPDPNILYVNLVNHNLFTSDTVSILNSTTDPIIDSSGIYTVNYVTDDIFSINFVFATFIPGTATIITGDKVTLTNTNSLPRIDGQYSINNKQTIISNTTGTVFSTVTTISNHNYSVNDLINIKGSDSITDGDYIIQSVTSNTFNIMIDTPIVTPGTEGIIINKSRFFINLGLPVVVTNGIFPAGTLNRSNTVVHYRIQPEISTGIDIGGIYLSNLNGQYKKIDRYIDTNNYMVRVVSNYSNKTVTAGGNNSRISSLIDGNRTVQANTDTGLASGTLSRAISLEGENYVFMISPKLDTVVNTSGIQNVFAKILLSESPGTLMFNSFISAPKIFDDPVARIETLSFKIVTSKNIDYYFNGVDYSFSLEITELLDHLTNVSVSSRTGNTEYQNLFSKNSAKLESNTWSAGTHSTGASRIRHIM